MYYLVIFIFLALYVICQSKPATSLVKYDRLFSAFLCIILVLLAAFRSDEVGADTAIYREYYEAMPNYNSFQSIVDYFSEYYIGYFLLSKLFSLAHMPVQVWFGFIEAFYLFSLMKYVGLYSKDKIFSLLIFVTVGLWGFSMAGEKQTLAMSFMMLSFVAIIKKKYIQSVILALISFYTHQVVLIFLAAFILYFVRNKKLFVPLIFILSGVIFVYSSFFLSSAANLLGNEKYDVYLDGDVKYTYVPFIFYSIITLIASINMGNYRNEKPDSANFTLGISILACAIQLLAVISGTLFRLALLFLPFMMILIPNAVYYSGKNKNIIRLVLMSFVIFYFLYTSRDTQYSFY